MSLPTNSGQAKDQGCNPVSSNCVVWQGPDLECIGLCKGDTISDVIHKMATELCTLVDMFDLGEYDLACLSVPASETPQDIGALLQILVNRICALENIDPIDPTNPTGDCPDNCIVPIADCFYYTDPQGDVVTTMSLTDYVNAIGNRICTILSDITILQNEVDSLQAALLDTQTDVTDLGLNKADKAGLYYQVNAQTSSSAGTQYITDALRYVEDYTLSYGTAYGTPTQLYQNILKAGLISQEDKMYGSGTMSSIPSWVVDVQTGAESIGNLWLTIHDLREQVAYMKDNCCSTGCSSIWLNFRAALTGTAALTVYTNGSTGFTNDWSECTGNTVVTVTDTLGNSTTFSTSLLAILNEPSGFTVSLAGTGVDVTLDLEVTADTCFINTAGGQETNCNEAYSYTVVNSAVCPPDLVLTGYFTSVNYQFSTAAGYTYICNVYYVGGGVPVASQIIASPGSMVAQSIPGLLGSTNYEFEIIVVDAMGNETACPRAPFATVGTDCQPPIFVGMQGAVLTI